MGASKPDVGGEPGLEAIHQTTTGYFRAMGKRILALRRSHEMTQIELARILGMSQQSVLSMEQGDRRVRIDLIPVLARAFGVTADARAPADATAEGKSNPGAAAAASGSTKNAERG